MESRGGNDLNFGATNLHAYWDYDAVESCLTYHRRLLGKLSDQYGARDFAAKLVAKEPANWKLDALGPVEAWSTKWADEILPLACEAHERLKFFPQEAFDKPRDGKQALRRTVIEAPHLGKDNYGVFASKAVERELPLAGWRLAALLEATLTPKP